MYREKGFDISGATRYTDGKEEPPTDIRDFTFRIKDGTEIHATEWSPDTDRDLVGAVQVVHGMSEHRKRYTHFARHLVDLGFAVYADDHRGHGETAGTLNTAGYFADDDGWNKVVSDLFTLTGIIKSEHPGLPLFLFGHSMGSFLARDYASQHGGELEGVILSGTGGDPGPALGFGLWLANRQIRSKGAKSQAFRLDSLSFGSYNRQFRPAVTRFDWLSRDDREVANYIADRYCGAVATAGFYRDMFTGIRKIHQRGSISEIPKDLPILFISGARDPVGRNGRGVNQVARTYRRAGIADVTVRLYPEARHELLHEINKAEVFADVSEWIISRLSGRSTDTIGAASRPPDASKAERPLREQRSTDAPQAGSETVN